MLPNSGIALQDNALGGKDVIIKNVNTDNIKMIFPELFPLKEQPRHIYVAPAIIIGDERYTTAEPESIVQGFFFVKQEDYHATRIISEMLNYGFSLKEILVAKFNIVTKWLPAPNFGIDPYTDLPKPQPKFSPIPELAPAPEEAPIPEDPFGINPYTDLPKAPPYQYDIGSGPIHPLQLLELEH